MDKDIKIESERESIIYNKGVECGRDHSVMSPETKEAIKVLTNTDKEKLDKKVFWQLFLPVVLIFVSAVGHLYVIYYGGIAALGTGIAVIEERTINMTTDIAEIRDDIKEATRPE